MGIPQGMQKIRDVTVNRRGNFPGLERKPPIKRLGDPANLESDNPAIKAAAEIKQAEDMKAQKIKAIKFLAEMGCGCYDKEGKITDALIAAMDDCTPDVRLASIQATEDAASGEGCSKCGSTSCCSEKVTKRLSEIAYERDDNGCRLEASAEVREAAAKALCICCPNRATGPIEEDIPEEEEPETIPTPEGEKKPDTIPGEGEEDPDTIEGEGGGDEMPLDGEDDSAGADAEADSEESAEELEEELKKKAKKAAETLTLLQSAQVAPLQAARVQVRVGHAKVIGGMVIQPVTISHVNATEPVSMSLSDQPTVPQPTVSTTNPRLPAPVVLQRPQAQPIRRALQPKSQPTAARVARPASTRSQTTVKSRPVTMRSVPVKRERITATVVGVDHRSGRVQLRSGQPFTVGASVAVHHRYLTGERLVAHLLIKEVNGSQAIAIATDAAGLSKIHSGDRADCF